MQGIPKQDWDKAVWSSIDKAFAVPVTRTDDVPARRAYARSSLSCSRRTGQPRCRLPKFSRPWPQHCALISTPLTYGRCELHELKRITIEARECANPYVKEAIEADKAKAAARSRRRRSRTRVVKSKRLEGKTRRKGAISFGCKLACRILSTASSRTSVRFLA